MAITAQQISDLRADFGDVNTVFTDAEISRLWDRMAAAINETYRHKATLGKMFEQILNQSTKLHDYRVASDQHNLDQVYKHLKDRYAEYKEFVDAVEGVTKSVVKVTARSRIHQTREEPDDANDTW